MKTKIENFLQNLDTDVDVLNYAFDSIKDIIKSNNEFNVELIYHSEAIKYLMKNDPSLQKSLAIAYDMGFTADNLNYKTLATLLASQNARVKFNELEEEEEEE